MFENTFCYSTVQVLLGLRGGASSLIGVGLTIQEEELKGEVSTLDLNSSVKSWGRVKRATLSVRAPPAKEEMERFFSLFSVAWREWDQWTQFEHNF